MRGPCTTAYKFQTGTAEHDQNVGRLRFGIQSSVLFSKDPTSPIRGLGETGEAFEKIKSRERESDGNSEHVPLEVTGCWPVSCSSTLEARVSLSPDSPTQMLRQSLSMHRSRILLVFAFWPSACKHISIHTQDGAVGTKSTVVLAATTDRKNSNPGINLGIS